MLVPRSFLLFMFFFYNLFWSTFAIGPLLESMFLLALACDLFSTFYLNLKPAEITNYNVFWPRKL